MERRVVDAVQEEGGAPEDDGGEVMIVWGRALA